jgi:hypothetical protein
MGLASGKSSVDVISFVFKSSKKIKVNKNQFITNQDYA